MKGGWGVLGCFMELRKNVRVRSVFLGFSGCLWKFFWVLYEGFHGGIGF